VRRALAIVALLSAFVVVGVSAYDTTTKQTAESTFVLEMETPHPATAPISGLTQKPVADDVAWVWRCYWWFDGLQWNQTCYWDYYWSDCWEGPVHTDCGWGADLNRKQALLIA
jgi:hypothetical protein